ncbi:MAG: hypothetical protein JKY65_15540, partial [Planctomycetes bacterium]|nr:hypothetical protein [Planctomycetota bacterium]
PPGYPPHPGAAPPPGFPPPAPLGDFADLEPMDLDMEPEPQPPGTDTEPFDGPIGIDDLF